MRTRRVRTAVSCAVAVSITVACQSTTVDAPSSPPVPATPSLTPAAPDPSVPPAALLDPVHVGEVFAAAVADGELQFIDEPGIPPVCATRDAVAVTADQLVASW